MKHLTAQQIKDIINKLIKEGKFDFNNLEKTHLKYLKEDEKKRYFEIKKVFSELKNYLEKKFPNRLIINKAKRERITGVNEELSERELFVKRQVFLAIDKQNVIMGVMMKILEGEIKLSQIFPNFDKYTLSNFYRTFCELMPRLFIDNLYLMIEDLELNSLKANWDDEKKKKISKLYKTEEISLSDMLYVLGSFEKEFVDSPKTRIIFEEYLDYDVEKGFILRNDVAHENKPFAEMLSVQDYINGILKVNSLLLAIILSFYLSDIQNLINEYDIKLIAEHLGWAK
ncbi:MAG TPA: hypothetical protein VJB35_04690 [Candidatus Nanoarchaeia archaeon]|nr:hypothetical protein [Candidatus Nanoarchaeia archaeon]